jgi:hypothetical protein
LLPYPVGVLSGRCYQQHLYFHRPVTPYRFTGFSKRSTLICAQHSTTSPYFDIHHAWNYLTIADCEALLEASPVFIAYSRLHHDSCLLSIHPIRQPQPKGYTFKPHHVWLFGCTLSCLDFHHGDLIRLLGGEYTNSSQPWDAIFETLDVLRDFPPLPGYPLVDLDYAHRAVIEGAPLAGIFESDYAIVAARNHYDNHLPLQTVLPKVRAKLLEGEALTYHILLSRFLWCFIPGLQISMMSWAVCKGKGGLIVDSSPTLNP